MNHVGFSQKGLLGVLTTFGDNGCRVECPTRARAPHVGPCPHYIADWDEPLISKKPPSLSCCHVAGVRCCHVARCRVCEEGARRIALSLSHTHILRTLAHLSVAEKSIGESMCFAFSHFILCAVCCCISIGMCLRACRCFYQLFCPLEAFVRIVRVLTRPVLVEEYWAGFMRVLQDRVQIGLECGSWDWCWKEVYASNDWKVGELRIESAVVLLWGFQRVMVGWVGFIWWL